MVRLLVWLCAHSGFAHDHNRPGDANCSAGGRVVWCLDADRLFGLGDCVAAPKKTRKIVTRIGAPGLSGLSWKPAGPVAQLARAHP